MELLEYQAKELFREVGIPILPSQRIDHPSELKSLKIPYPIVLKSQVPASGRASAGGIRFAENTIDAIAATRNIFNLAILGEYPSAVLAEVKYNAHQEFYLGVVLDYSLRRPLLLGSIQGGRDLEFVLQSMHYVVVDQQFSPFYARKLLVKMGITGHLLHTVSSIIEKMYYLFVQKDLDIIEINPLGISVTGEVMALDGKISINDTAIARHPELSLIRGNMNNHLEYMPLDMTDALSNMAILCNATGTAMTTIDLLGENNIKPAYCLVISEEKKWEIAWEKVINDESIKILLINIIGSEKDGKKIMNIIQEYWENRMIETADLTKQNKTYKKGAKKPLFYPQLILRIATNQTELFSEENLMMMPIHQVKTLEEAVKETIYQSKLAQKN